MAKGIVAKFINIKAGSRSKGAGSQIAASIVYIENPEKVGKPIDLISANQLGNELTYVTDDIKTVQGLYIGSRHITDISHATEEMMQVKTFYEKCDGRVAIHGIISLDHEESDVKNSGKLMLLLNDVMKEVFPQHQVVFAVHTNTDNLHIHYVINTVGLDGKKIHMDNNFMHGVFNVVVNKYAKKYGFTENEEWKKEKKSDSMPIAARKMLLRKLIDHAIEQTDTFDAFIAYLRDDGVTVNVGKNISLQMEEMPRAMRSGQLGDNYKISNILERLATKYDPFQRGRAGEYYEAILPEKMANIVPTRMKKYKDMSSEERRQAVHLLRLDRNPWRENMHDNWQMQRSADAIDEVWNAYRLVHFYSNGTDNAKSAMQEIIDRRKELSAERKELRALQRKYKPITDIYEEMKKYMAKAYLYDAYGKKDYISDFMEYKKLSDRLEVSFGKSVEEVADFVAETRSQIDYLKGQEKELSKQYVSIKRFAEQGKIQGIANQCSFFHAIGHSEAMYQAKKFGVYTTDLKYITPIAQEDADEKIVEKLKDIEIRVMTTPDRKDDKGIILTEVTVMKKGIIIKEFSSKDMDEKQFNKVIYEIQDEYGIECCSVKRNKVTSKSRQI